MKVTIFVLSALTAIAAATPTPFEGTPIATRDEPVPAHIEARQNCGSCVNGKRTCWFCTPAGGCGASSWSC